MDPFGGGGNAPDDHLSVLWVRWRMACKLFGSSFWRDGSRHLHLDPEADRFFDHNYLDHDDGEISFSCVIGATYQMTLKVTDAVGATTSKVTGFGCSTIAP